MADFVDEPARRTRIAARTQVLVVGGGSAGAAAAIASARTGADTMLVERYGGLGGLATGGLIVLLLTLDDGAGEQVIAGLCQEMVDRITRRGGAFAPPAAEWGSPDSALVETYRRWGLVWGSGPHRVRYSVAYDPEEMRFALNEMVEASGARLLMHAWGCEPLCEGSRVIGVTVQGKSGRFAILADVVIDATGDGDVFAAAGARSTWKGAAVALVQHGRRRGSAAALDAGGWFFRDGRRSGVDAWGATERIIPRSMRPSADLTLAELDAARWSCARSTACAPRSRSSAMPISATRRGSITEPAARGQYVLSREADTPFDDAIGVTGPGRNTGPYWIPYRCLRVRGDILLAAGRCISVDHRVHRRRRFRPAW
jgi:hypothetical protein